MGVLSTYKENQSQIVKYKLKRKLIVLQKSIIQHYFTYGLSSTQKIFKKSKKWIYYWKNKEVNSNFHSNNHGGARNFRFTQEELKQIWEILWNQCQTMPTS